MTTDLSSGDYSRWTEGAVMKFAGVIYTPQSAAHDLFANFARHMSARGWRVGGIVQEARFDDAGRRIAIDAVALDNGDRYPINRPTERNFENKECSLDASALVAASAVLRRAIDAKVDLLLVEKFGEQEQQGDGMMSDILDAVAEGIPVLVALPAQALDAWRKHTGGLGDLLSCDEAALRQWWGAAPLLRELIRAVEDVPVSHIQVGLNWTLVAGENSAGLAQTAARGANGCRTVPDAGGLAERSLRDLAGLALSSNPFEVAIGLAAINSHFNLPNLIDEQSNGLDAFLGCEGKVTAIGRFPGLAERYGNLRIVEREPREGEYPQAAGPGLLRDSEAALITASTLRNGSLPDLLDSRGRYCRTALVGPSTPLSPVLFDYGIEILSGLVINDIPAAVRAVAQGGSVQELKKCGRYATLRAKDL